MKLLHPLMSSVRLAKISAVAAVALLLAGCPDKKLTDPAKQAEPPAISLTSPAASATLTTDSATVEGTVTSSEPITRLAYALNGAAEQTVAIQPGTSVDFRFTVPLRAGANTLEVSATGASGRKGTQTLNITADACIPALSASSARAAAELIVGGVPARLAELRGHVRVPATGQLIAVPAERRANGDVVIVVPLHPNGRAGGEAELVLSDAGSTCRALPFTIEALPDAKGTTEAVISGTTQLLAALAGVFGVDVVALLADPAALPPELRPLAIAARLLDGPHNPNSLQAMRAGTAPLLQGVPLDEELLDALLARSGIPEALQAFQQQITALGPPPAASAAAAYAAAGQSTGPLARARTAALASATAAITPEQLNYWTQVRNLAAAWVLPEQQVEASHLALAGQLLSQLAQANSIGDFLLAYASMNVAAAVGLQYDALLGVKTGLTQLLPSKLDPLLLQVDQTTLSVGASSSWRASVSARGETWSVFLPAYLEHQLVNLGPLGTALNQLLPRVDLTGEQQANLLNLVGYLQSSLLASLGKVACSELVCWVAADPVVYGPAEVTEAGRSLVAFTPQDVLALVEGDRRRVRALALTPTGAPAKMQVRTMSGWFNGQTAIGEQAITISDAPPAPDGLVADFISAGGFHTCALTATGEAYCWGENTAGKLGDGTLTERHTPRPVAASGLTFTSISVGMDHTCAVTAAGTAYCWGTNRHGELGIGEGTEERKTNPTPVAGALSFAAISAGHYHTCGITKGEGKAYCWGLNIHAQLGDGTKTGSATPVAVNTSLRFMAIGAGAASCALATDGKPYCWGSQWLDDGSGAVYLTPTAVPDSPTFASLSVGSHHYCALTDSGKAYCWGMNGVLGDGASQPRSTPSEVAGNHSFASISTGSTLSCGITRNDHKAYCWGHNNFGGLGDGTVLPRLTPTAVEGGLSFTRTTNGAYFSCGVSTSGEVYCWGENNRGQLGDGTTQDRHTPAKVKQEQ